MVHFHLTVESMWRRLSSYTGQSTRQYGVVYRVHVHVAALGIAINPFQRMSILFLLGQKGSSKRGYTYLADKVYYEFPERDQKTSGVRECCVAMAAKSGLIWLWLPQAN